MDSPLLRPLVGRRVALELYPARPVTWLGPVAATICGAIAAGGLALSGETFLRVAIAILLTDPILGAWRAAWVHTDWRRPMQGWQAAPTRAWMLVPYARLGSPAARFSQWLSSRARFWREAVLPHVGQSISAIVVTALIALSIALALGSAVFILTVIALIFAPLESELGEERAGRWARALSEIGLAWLIGDAAISAVLPPVESAALAIPFAMAYRGLLSVPVHPRLGFAIMNMAQLAIIVFLAARGSIINAAILAFALGAQVLWQAAVRDELLDRTAFLRHVQWFVLLAMAAAALGIP